MNEVKLHAFAGGLVLPQRKEASAKPTVALPTPATVSIPLGRARVLVAPGDDVREGQPIAVGEDERVVAAHASVPGRVVGITSARVLDRVEPCLVIEARTTDAAPFRYPPLGDDAEPAALRARLREAGLAGLGGAAFPTSVKLATPVELLVVNGAECEPYIACDDRLLRERATEVTAGARWLARVVGAKRIVLAIEDSMSDALAAVRSALAVGASSTHGVPLELVEVPTIYPQGGERQLIRVLTGREVPSGGLPRDLGVVVQNVGTAAAAFRAIAHGEPLTRRFVSVTGPGVASPCTVDARIGTPVANLVDAAGGYTPAAERLVVGGPMMGVALDGDAAPVAKSTNAVLVLDRAALREPAPVLPCIRCGECARVCPAALLPQQLHFAWLARDHAELARHALFDCIECGLCAYVCPSRLPLVEEYRLAKTELTVAADRARRASVARVRHEARAARLARLEAERAAKLAARTEVALAERPAEDPIAAALARAAAKKKT